MTNALDVFVDTTKAIHALDIPSKEMAEKLVRSAMRMVAEDLKYGNVEGAIQTKNKVDALDRYFRAQHVDLVTQNTVAVGRLSLIRQIGKYIKNKYFHGHETNTDPQRERDKNGAYKLKENQVITEQQPGKYLKDLPIGSATYLKWMDASIPTEKEFNEWADYFTSEGVKEEDEVYFILFLKKFFSSKYGGNDDNINLDPHIKRAYLAWGEIIDAYLIIDQVMSGDTPIEQINILRDQMNKAIEVVNSSIKKFGELYK